MSAKRSRPNLDSGAAPKVTTTTKSKVTASPRQPTLAERIARVPIVFGFASPPVGRRTLWQIVVTECPRCGPGIAHVHKSTGCHGGLRVGSCGQAYRIRIAGTKRGRLAAAAGGGQ